MNKRTLLNAVTQKIKAMYQAAQKIKTIQQATRSIKPQAKPAAPTLDPALEDYAGMTHGGIFDHIHSVYRGYPSLSESRNNANVMNYYVDKNKGDVIIGKATISPDKSLRKSLRESVAENSAKKLYPSASENYNALKDAAIRFGEYRQLQQQNRGTLKNSLQFKDWARDNAPQVYREFMSAPKDARQDVLWRLKFQVNNRRNKRNGYI